MCPCSARSLCVVVVETALEFAAAFGVLGEGGCVDDLPTMLSLSMIASSAVGVGYQRVFSSLLHARTKAFGFIPSKGSFQVFFGLVRVHLYIYEHTVAHSAVCCCFKHVLCASCQPRDSSQCMVVTSRDLF